MDIAERQYLIRQRLSTRDAHGNAQDTYAGRQSAWHQMGNVLGHFATAAEIMVAGDADFHVFKSQLRDGLGRPFPAWGTFRWNLADRASGAKDKAIPLGLVGKDYSVIQTHEVLSLLDHLVGQIDGAHYETLGTLDFGRVVWVQVDLNFSIRVGNDESKAYLSAHTSHDGSRAAEFYETCVRMVCRNTWRAGSLSRLAATLRVAHRGDTKRKLANLKDEIAEIKHTALTMQEKLTFLSRKQVTKQSIDSIFDRLFPQPKSEDGKPQPSKRRENILVDVLSLFESNDHNAFPEQRGTAYSLLNSIIEYADHYRTARSEAESASTLLDDSPVTQRRNPRAESALFGSGARLKESALSLILEEAENMPLARLAANQTVERVDALELLSSKGGPA